MLKALAIFLCLMLPSMHARIATPRSWLRREGGRVRVEGGRVRVDAKAKDEARGRRCKEEGAIGQSMA